MPWIGIKKADAARVVAPIREKFPLRLGSIRFDWLPDLLWPDCRSSEGARQSILTRMQTPYCISFTQSYSRLDMSNNLFPSPPPPHRWLRSHLFRSAAPIVADYPPTV